MALKKYRVVAEETVVLGHSTGETFEADFSEEAGYNEDAILASGAVALLTDDEPEEKPRELTKEELLDITRERGISSDSSMTKEQIKAAIAEHEAGE
jgi:hypothetical protein